LRAVEPLIGALEDRNPRVREAAARSLGELGHPRAFEPLCRALADRAYPVRVAAAAGLAKVAAAAEARLADPGRADQQHAFRLLQEGELRQGADVPLIEPRLEG